MYVHSCDKTYVRRYVRTTYVLVLVPVLYSTCTRTYVRTYVGSPHEQNLTVHIIVPDVVSLPASSQYVASISSLVPEYVDDWGDVDDNDQDEDNENDDHDAMMSRKTTAITMAIRTYGRTVHTY